MDEFSTAILVPVRPLLTAWHTRPMKCHGNFEDYVLAACEAAESVRFNGSYPLDSCDTFAYIASIAFDDEQGTGRTESGLSIPLLIELTAILLNVIYVKEGNGEYFFVQIKPVADKLMLIGYRSDRDEDDISRSELC